jgi:hypothetical protein
VRECPWQRLFERVVAELRGAQTVRWQFVRPHFREGLHRAALAREAKKPKKR